MIVIAPVWIAVAGVLTLAVRERPTQKELLGASQPPFLVFVLALAIVVREASQHGLSSVVDALVPHRCALLTVLAVPFVSAVVANVVHKGLPPRRPRRSLTQRAPARAPRKSSRVEDGSSARC